MSGMPSGALQPTWIGHVATTRDALLLFEACLNGTLHHVPRRPHDRERSQLIKSGCVFIYEENASGIKRWTDGVPWSPSRILGNFLVYRELVKPFPPGEKKRATKRNRRPTRPGEPYPRQNGSEEAAEPTTPTNRSDGADGRESERALIGSLVDSYGFKEGGLVKKTMSVQVHGVQHHLVSYYKIDDAIDGKMSTPIKDPRLVGMEPRPELLTKQNFRAPLDENDDGMGDGVDPSGHHAYSGYHPGGYDHQRHHMMLTGHPQHQGVNMAMYAAPPYTAPHMQPGMHAYSSVNSAAPSYYVKQEDYAPYGQSSYQNPTPMPQERSQHTPHQASSYAYRPTMPMLTPRQNGAPDGPTTQQDHRASDTSSWHRNTGVYGPTAPQAAPSAAYQNGNHQWGMSASSPHQGLPRPDLGGAAYADGTGWNPLSARPQAPSYNNAPQHHSQ